MMDQDADISGTKARMPVQPIPDITQEVLETYADRESGFRSKKTFTVSPTLKACAEDELVKKDYKEMRCDIPGLTKSTFLMVFSPDGTKMASTHGNHNVYVTDLRTGKNIKTLVGHPRTPWCVAFHPSSNQILASGCLGGQVRIWDLSGGSEVWTAESQTVISSLAFHPVDRLLVIATYNELYFWDWSQPKPFMQTCTSNAKEKVRYVAFDRLGHKLITGIANTPQGFTRWERVRAPVPVARHSDRITAYRRRITPRIVTTPQVNPSVTPPTPPENPPNQNSIPERERRIATCYRNLVEQYEMLVHRYLEAYRPATTIDRGTDPMEAEHLNNTDPQPSTSAITTTIPTCSSTSQTNAVTPTTSGTSQASASAATTRNSPPCVPGPSGLSRFSRPNKRSNVPGSKSDSSTVYQSDSSSSSSSDESPTPKRRISLVPNSNLFRNKSEASVNKSTKDNTGTRKKLFISRPSAFHSTRSNPNVSNTSGNNRRVYDRFLPNPTLSLDTRLSDLPEQRARNLAEPSPPNSSNSRFDNLPLLLRGISEGTLSSADEVINFSERPIRDEPEAEPPENFTIQSPAEFANQATGIENMYGHILTDLETTLREARDFRIRRTEERRNNLNRNVFLSFSERLENIMNQSDGILANLRRSVELLMDPSIQRQLQPQQQQQQPPPNPEPEPSTSRLPEPETPPPPIPEASTSEPSTSAEPAQSENSRNKIYILRKPSGFHRQYSRAGTSSRTNPSFQTYPGSARLQRYFRIRQPRLNVRPHNSSSSVWRPFDDHSYPRDPEQTNNNNPTNESQRSNVEPIRSLLTLSPRSPSTTPAEPEESEQSDPESRNSSQFRPDPRLVDPVTGNRELPPDEIPPGFGSDPITDHNYSDLLSRLRSVRGRLEQVSQNFNLGRNQSQPGNSSSTTEHEPMRSTDESPSDDRESEPFEGFQSQWDQPLHDTSERLYRTQHINLYPPDPPSSSQSSPERNVQSGNTRYWNVPTVQVNDVPVAEVIQNSPRIWLHRYPTDLRPLSAATGLFRPRFLIPLYAGVNPFDQDLDDPQREGPVGYDGIISTTVSPNHRIQMWDISKCNIPNISNHEKNIVVSECKIHNDGSVDISSDGTLLVTLLPSGGYLNVTNRLGIYSIKWDTLGQCLYTTSFEQNAISVSLSPLSRHLIVGLASRRVTLLPSDRWTMARIFLLDDRKIKIMGRGRLVVLRDLEQGRERDLNFMSVNCIKWMPVSGQGIVYATNTGQLKVLT